MDCRQFTVRGRNSELGFNESIQVQCGWIGRAVQVDWDDLRFPVSVDGTGEVK